MKTKYLFFDIDGTLAAGGYGNTYIPESCWKAIRRLEEAGHVLALCTGRSFAMAKEFLTETGFRYMVSDGGNGITIDGKLQGITPLDRDNVIALVRECQAKGYPWAIQTDDSTVRKAPDDTFYDYTHDTYMDTETVPGLDPEDYPDLYKAYVACYYPDELKLESLKRLPWCRFHKEYVFVEPCDKAAGIRKMMDHFQAPYEDVIVFGDSRNDLSMFVDDWTCVAMGNACDELKEKADLITTAVDDDGIWNACVRLNLF